MDRRPSQSDATRQARPRSWDASMSILVVGGAGYIGSHAVRELEKAGHDVWVYDNLGLGPAEAARPERLIRGDLLDRDALESALRGRGIDAVMHFAAYASVPESVGD